MKPITFTLALVCLLFAACKQEQKIEKRTLHLDLMLDAYKGKKIALRLPADYSYTYTGNLWVYPYEDSIEIRGLARGEGNVLYWQEQDTFLNVSVNVSSTPEIDTAMGVLRRDSMLEIVNYPAARRLYEMIMVNKQLPDFDIASVEGDRITDDDIKGKISVINFWYVGCAPCMVEIPALQEAGEYLRANGHELYAFCKDTGYVKGGEPHFYYEGQRAGKDKLFKRFYGFENIELDAIHGVSAAKVAESFKVSSYPTTFMTDKRGRIRHVVTGGAATIEAEIKRCADMLVHLQ